MKSTKISHVGQNNRHILILTTLLCILMLGSNLSLAAEEISYPNSQEMKWEISSLEKTKKSVMSLRSTKKIVSEMVKKTVSSSAIMQRKGTLIEPVSSLGEEMSPGLFFPVAKNTPIRAVHRGTVVYADRFRGYGFLVILDHGDRIFSLYGHNRQLLVAYGDEVRSRQVIAKSGNAGVRNRANGLYFEIRQGYKPQNLQKWLVDRTKTSRKMAKAMM